MPWEILVAVHLLRLTGPEQQGIELNPKSIVSLRTPRVAEHFWKGARCLINTTDGKIVVVQETCDEVIKLIEGMKP
jgi:uncharacterized protein YlzI (FlbEa/FlbD family)